jgi:hypothetical protein
VINKTSLSIVINKTSLSIKHHYQSNIIINQTSLDLMMDAVVVYLRVREMVWTMDEMMDAVIIINQTSLSIKHHY